MYNIAYFKLNCYISNCKHHIILSVSYLNDAYCYKCGPKINFNKIYVYDCEPIIVEIFDPPIFTIKFASKLCYWLLKNSKLQQLLWRCCDRLINFRITIFKHKSLKRIQLYNYVPSKIIFVL